MNQQRYAHILRDAGIGVWEWNRITHEMHYSPAWAEVLGYSVDDIPAICETKERLCHPDDLQNYQRALEAHCLGTTEQYTCTLRLRQKNGDYIWVKDQGQVVSWKDGSPEWMTGYHTALDETGMGALIKKTFIDQAPGAIAMFDTQLNYLAASRQWLIDYNLPEAIEGQNHYDLFDIPERWKEIHRKCLQGEIHQAEEDEFFDRTGAAFYLRWQVKPWYHQGEIGGLLMQTSNLTHFKQLQFEQKRQQAFQKTVFDSINVGIVACNAEKELTYFNKTSREWHGLPSKSVPASELSHYYSLYKADGKSLLEEADIPLLKVLEGKVLGPDEIISIKTAAKNRYVRVTGNQLYDEKEQLIGAVVAMHDITEIITANQEKQLIDTTFKSSFENAPIGMALVSPEGNWLQINQKISDILGYTKEELSGMTFQELTHPEDLELDLSHVNALRTGERDSYQIEKRYFHKTGRVVTVILSVSVVRDKDLIPLFFISQITDISTQRKSENDLKQVLRLTQDQNNRLKNFSHIVSHNLRSHSGNLNMLVAFLNEELDGKLKELMQMMDSATGQLAETIAHLNEVTEIQTNENAIRKTVCLKEYILRTTNTLSAVIKENNISIVDQTPANLVVKAIPAYLESILLNFTSNAIKYRSTKRASYIKFCTEVKSKEIMLTIEDNGLGMDLKKYGERLFGMYNTFHKHKDSRGIGLFITKNQIEAMGGRVTVESTIDVGTTFTIYLPYEEAYTNSLSY